MATKRIPRPRDPLARAKLIGDIATGQVVDAMHDGKGSLTPAREFARSGGLKGGRARADALTPKERREIARKAALSRWAKVKEDKKVR